MITILFSKAKLFPAGPVRTLLSKQVPLYSWTCGELDDGQGDCPTPFDRPILIGGRTASHSIFIEVRADHRDEPGLPPHAQKIRIDRPTTDSAALAERIACVIASTTAFVDRDAALLRFDGSDRWMSVEEAVKLTDLVMKGEGLAGILPAFGRPAGAIDAAPPPPSEPAAAPAIASRIANLPYADRRPRERSAILGFDTLIMATTEKTMAQALAGTGMAGVCDFGALPPFHDEQVRATSLPTLAILFDRYVPHDRDKLAEILAVFDEDGGWSVAVDGEDTLMHGRGGTVRLSHHDTPLPPWMVELALDRSLGATPGEPMARLRAHRRYVTIRADLDCAVASWLDIRQTAKAMVCAMAIVARPQHDTSAYAVGCYNAATDSCFTGDMMDDLVGALAQNEVSIKTFVWHAFPETAPGHVSISSSGLLPFIGREVEVLDAPGPIEHVGEQLNMIERYLLIEGPVMGDGDTIAAEPGNPLARAFHAMSDAHGRPEPVPVLRFEIRGPDGRWRPRHDPPRDTPPIGSGGLASSIAPRPPAREPATAGFGRRTGGFGRRGL